MLVGRRWSFVASWLRPVATPLMYSSPSHILLLMLTARRRARAHTRVLVEITANTPVASRRRVVRSGCACHLGHPPRRQHCSYTRPTNHGHWRCCQVSGICQQYALDGLCRSAASGEQAICYTPHLDCMCTLSTAPRRLEHVLIGRADASAQEGLVMVA